MAADVLIEARTCVNCKAIVLWDSQEDGNQCSHCGKSINKREKKLAPTGVNPGRSTGRGECSHPQQEGKVR